MEFKRTGLQAPTLEYRSPDQSNASGEMPWLAHAAIGLIAYVAACISALLISIATASFLGLSLVLLLIVPCAVAHNRGRWRGFVAGVLAGIALTPIVIMICVLVTKQIR